MERMKKIIVNQWKITPLWVKIVAVVGLIGASSYFVEAFLVLTNQAELGLANSGFAIYVLSLKIFVGGQFLLFGIHLAQKLNQKVGPNLELRRNLTKIQAYLRRIHPLLGITTLVMALAHAVWNFSRFLSFSWPWTLQVVSGVVGISIILLVALSGDGALLAPGKQRKKVIVVHTILALIFLIPFLIHI
ncbi:MAG: hypothetical protein ACRC17_11695 [Culicoidibacterales bacterium]